ncbi:MAG: CBS domain-containing protein [Methylophilaceae bacterium]|jgi:CBS domain-containing protein|nr:MAG: CBS domain-containing protein [Methylophilaceae bacterium]
MKTLKQILKEKQHQDVISIAPDKTVFEALGLMADKGIGALAVMENNTLVGIFSERDYAREVALKNKASKTTTVSAVMTSKLIYGQASDFVASAMNTMTNKRVRHLPVMEDDEMIGMLSIGDLVKATIEYQEELIQQLESYIRS